MSRSGPTRPLLADDLLTRLMTEWEQPLFAFAWHYLRDRELAGDLVAATFVRFYHQCPRLRAGATPASWLFGALAEQCQRQVWRAATVPETDAELALLSAAIAHLPHPVKTTWLLHQCTTLDLAQIGAVLQLGPEETTRCLHRARQLLTAGLAASPTAPTPPGLATAITLPA